MLSSSIEQFVYAEHPPVSNLQTDRNAANKTDYYPKRVTVFYIHIIEHRVTVNDNCNHDIIPIDPPIQMGRSISHPHNLNVSETSSENNKSSTETNTSLALCKPLLMPLTAKENFFWRPKRLLYGAEIKSVTVCIFHKESRSEIPTNEVYTGFQWEK